MREHEYQCVYKNDPIAIAMASQMQQISTNNAPNSKNNKLCENLVLKHLHILFSSGGGA